MVPVAAAPGNAQAAASAPQGQQATQAANWVSTATDAPDPQNRLLPIPPYEKEAADTAASAPAARPGNPGGAAPSTVKPPTATPVDPTAPLQWSSGNPTPTTPNETIRSAQQSTTTTGQNVTVKREPVQENPPRIARYGHSQDYAQLRGQLEYVAKDRVWKLRYIPIHGQQDAYGGQFTLSEGAKLEAFQAGDYVTVEGSPTKENSAAGRAHYIPSRVAPLSP